MHNIWSADGELANIVRHFQRLANEEIAAGVAQLHVMVNDMSQGLGNHDTRSQMTYEVLSVAPLGDPLLIFTD